METVRVNDREFFIKKLLGHGKGGYSYLVEDENKCLFVVKKIHHEPCDYYNFGNKIEAEKNDYKRLMETGIPIPKMFSVDEQRETILKEFIDGDTAFSLIKNNALPENAISQIQNMAQKVKSLGLNIDYFPTNFVLQNGLFYYIDYECNSYMEEWNFDNWGVKYWSRTKEFNDYLKDHSDL